MDNVPKAIGKLFCLRYLGLRGTRISNLPNSVCRLKHLLTPDILGTEVKKTSSWD